MDDYFYHTSRLQPPRLIVNGKYKDIDVEKYDPNGKLGITVNDYERDSTKHYHQFIDACLGRDKVSAPFSYSSRLTETILLGVIAGRFLIRLFIGIIKKRFLRKVKPIFS